MTAYHHDWQRLYSEAQQKAETLQAELTELRQAVWDARATLGFDNDGAPTPDARKEPTLAELVKRDATEFRKDYDDSLAESTSLEDKLLKLEDKLLKLKAAAYAVCNAGSDIEKLVPAIAKLRGSLIGTGRQQ